MTHTDLQGLLERATKGRDALRYVLNFADEAKRISTVMHTFTLPDRVKTKDRLEALWAALPMIEAALADLAAKDAEIAALDRRRRKLEAALRVSRGWMKACAGDGPFMPASQAVRDLKTIDEALGINP